jgi:hypothetical protein
MAEAEAEAIRRIGAALPAEHVGMYLLGQKYIENLPALTQGKGTTFFLPAEASGVMAALGGLREMLRAHVGDSAGETKAPSARASVRAVGDGGQRSGE